MWMPPGICESAVIAPTGLKFTVTFRQLIVALLPAPTFTAYRQTRCVPSFTGVLIVQPWFGPASGTNVGRPVRGWFAVTEALLTPSTCMLTVSAAVGLLGSIAQPVPVIAPGCW